MYVINSRLFIISCLIFVLSACNNAGEGIGGKTYTIKVNPEAINFQAISGGSTPASQLASVSFNGAGLLVGIVPGTTLPSWLDISAPSTAIASPVAVSFSITDTDLPAGNYNTIIRYATGNLAATDGVVKDMPLSYTVLSQTPNTSPLATSVTNVDFSSEFGATSPPAPSSITVTAPGIVWTASTNVGWLAIDQSTGTGTADVSISVDSSGLLAGIHSGQISFQDTVANTSVTVDVSLTITVPKLLTTNVSQLNFSSVLGSSNPPGALSIGVAGSDIPWTATSDSAWLSIDKSSGLGAANIIVNASPTGLAVGEHLGKISITNSNNNATVVVDVSLIITMPSITASQSEIVINAINGEAINPSTISLSVNNGQIVTWTATTTDDWITLNGLAGSATGSTAESLAIGIDMANLGSGIYTGSVTISAVVNSQVISTTVAVNLSLTQPSLTASTPEITINAINGSPINPSTINLSVNNGQTVTWTATTTDNWITLNGLAGSATGSTAESLAVGIDAANLASGIYSGSVNIDSTVNNDVISTTVTVNLELTPATISLSSPDILFSAINGAAITKKAFSATLNTGDNAYAWNMAITADDGNGGQWLLSDTLSGMISAATPALANPTLSVDASQLASAMYNGSIEISAQVNGDLVSASLPVSLSLTKATLSLSASNAIFTGVNSTNLGTATFNAALNTGSVDYPWNATISASDGGNGAWLVADKISGRLSETVTQDIVLSIDTSVILGGTYTGDITIQSQVNGDVISATFTVNLNLEQHRLFIADNGVALTGFPTVSAGLSHSVSVTDNAGTTTAWAASSDQAWLTVTGSGNTGGTLNLTANTNGISTDTLHYATVTVSSNSTTIENTQTIQVGLWVSSTDLVDPAPITTQYSQITADPIRPYVYVHRAATDIDIYNVHTGTLVNTISSVGAVLGDMEVSSDGSILYVADNTNFDIVPIDLNTSTILPVWNLNKTTTIQFAFSRPNSMSVLIVDDGTIRNAETGSPLGPTFGTGYYGTQTLAASLNGNRFCGINNGLSPYTISCYDTSYSFLNGGKLTLSSVVTGSAGSNGKDVALNADGSKVYAASGAPYTFIVFDGNTMAKVQSLPADAYPNNVEMGSNGLLYGGIYGIYGPLDVWIYNDAGVEQYSGYVSGYAREILDRQLVVSGDGRKMAVLTSDPSLQFLTAP